MQAIIDILQSVGIICVAITSIVHTSQISQLNG
jgi:hypothetical protein